MMMEFMECGSLHDVLHNHTAPLDHLTSIRLLSQVAGGLQYLHQANPPIIHGDIKTDNILLDHNFVPKVGAFCMSTKAMVRGGQGSPFWMAPECVHVDGDCEKSSLTPAGDVFSFGVTMWEVFTQQEPYEKLLECFTPLQILRRIKDDNLRPEMMTTVPPTIRSLISRCWQSDPMERPSIGEVKDLLEAEMKYLESRASFDMGETETPNTRVNLLNHLNLLHQIFPSHIAKSLSLGHKVEPETFDPVTIFFSDIVGYTDLSASLPPQKVMRMLDNLYTQLDALCTEAKLFKVETIGDAYMCVGGLPEMQENHTVRVALFALSAIKAANSTLVDEDEPKLGHINIRVGFHSGPVVASVVGELNPRYCLFGDTVNTASRMESNSEKNMINMSPQAYKCLVNQLPIVATLRRGKLTIKGKGQVQCYFLVQDEKNFKVIRDHVHSVTS